MTAWWRSSGSGQNHRSKLLLDCFASGRATCSEFILESVVIIFTTGRVRFTCAGKPSEPKWLTSPTVHFSQSPSSSVGGGGAKCQCTHLFCNEIRDERLVSIKVLFHSPKQFTTYSGTQFRTLNSVRHLSCAARKNHHENRQCIRTLTSTIFISKFVSKSSTKIFTQRR